jgi:hypothetical protein
LAINDEEGCSVVEPDEMYTMEEERRKAREAAAAARDQQGLDEDEAAGEEESSPELDAAWEKEKERVKQERDSES